MKKVVVIVGPTGSGKTKISIELAKRFGFEIINGDSVQIYQRLNIGSAKIKEDEKQGITHHLLDVCDPKASYTAYNFQKDVRKLINEIKYPMIVGGTGLYIKAALYDYEFLDEDQDSDFENKYKEISNEALYQKLIELDPDIKIDYQNRRRVLRALQQAMLGQPRSQKIKKDEPLYELCVIYLDLERHLQEEKLNIRLERQLNEGFIDEVLSLRKDNIHVNAIGYREVDQYLNQEISFEDMKSNIISASKKLAKKQKTWFKNQMKIYILDATSPTLLKDSYRLIDQFLNR